MVIVCDAEDREKDKSRPDLSDLSHEVPTA